MRSGRRYFACNNRPVLLLFALVILAGGFGSWCEVAGQEPPGSATHNEAEPPKPQPILFSHKLHCQFVTDCLTCHAMSANGWEMSYPSEGKCMECHATNRAESPAISKLAGYYNEHQAVPWVKIYSLPDEILFSHKRHYTKGKIDCAVCHGPVAEREVITKERSISMQSCIDCHKERKAASTCRSCHNR